MDRIVINIRFERNLTCILKTLRICNSVVRFSNMYNTIYRTRVKEIERMAFFFLFFFLINGFGLNRPWVLFGNCCGGDVSRDILKQFPIEKDRGRSR